MKILVVRFSSIGDVVLTTPVIRCLKTQLNQAEIHVITKKSMTPILENNPYIDKCIAIEKSVKEVSESLKAEKYDVVIDLHNNVRTLKLKRSLGVKSYSFPKKNISKFLLTTFHWNRMPKVHVVDRYFEAVKALGVVNDQQPCDLFLTSNDQVDLATWNLSEKSFVGVAMGAQFATKQMPVELMANVLGEIDLPIVLLGGEMDQLRAKELVQLLAGRNIIDLTGKLTLRQSAYLTKTACVLLTGDTGLMHIASAFETPIVSVWGNTVPDLGMYTYAPKNNSVFSNHEVNGLSCRPCSKIGYQSCPKKHFNCMMKQDVSAIRKDLQERISTVNH